jgi:hypothetical protein
MAIFSGGSIYMGRKRGKPDELEGFAVLFGMEHMTRALAMTEIFSQARILHATV